VDCGAYSFYPFLVSLEAAVAIEFIPGPYDIRHYAAEAVAVATNKTPNAPYRGIARVPACFTIERALDQVARTLDLDPVEVRRRNMVRPEQMPYTSASGLVYDSGRFEDSLDALVECSDLEGLREWRDSARRDGRHIGIGVAAFVQETAYGVEQLNRVGFDYEFQDDFVSLTLERSGRYTIAGSHFSHGQGLETSLAQLGAERLGVPPEHVVVVQGDTGRVPSGNGTWGSRSAVIFGAAVELAVDQMQARLAELGGGRELSHAELAEAWWDEHGEPLTVTAAAPRDQRGAYPNGAHLAAVEVDVETGSVEVLRYVLSNDSGHIINPAIAEGQLHGGVCQGIGGALYEEFLYSDEGQPLSTSFLEYVVPTAREIPDIEIRMLDTPAPNVIGGRKGIGEAGAVAPQAVIASAVEDAIAPLGPVFVGETPLTPARVRGFVELAMAGGGR
jgi:carbon-monoxide dehydrogenase large subunit